MGGHRAVGTCDNRPMTTTLKSKLQQDLNAAIKGRDELRSSTLRLTLAAITKEEVAGKVNTTLAEISPATNVPWP